MNRVESSKRIADSLRVAALEVETKGPVGKIDWQNFFAMMIQLLPIIIALFANPDEEKPAV